MNRIALSTVNNQTKRDRRLRSSRDSGERNVTNVPHPERHEGRPVQVRVKRRAQKQKDRRPQTEALTGAGGTAQGRGRRWGQRCRPIMGKYVFTHFWNLFLAPMRRHPWLKFPVGALGGPFVYLHYLQSHYRCDRTPNLHHMVFVWSLNPQHTV